MSDCCSILTVLMGTLAYYGSPGYSDTRTRGLLICWDLGWEADCAGQPAVGGHKNTNTVNYLSQEKILKIHFDQSLMSYKEVSVEGGRFIKQTRYSHHTSH